MDTGSSLKHGANRLPQLRRSDRGPGWWFRHQRGLAPYLFIAPNVALFTAFSFLPVLFAIYISDQWAAVFGMIWILGRILYTTGYSQAAEKRSMGFGIQAMAGFILWVGALGAPIWRLIHS